MSNTRTQCRVERERDDAIDGVDICRKPKGHEATDPEHHDPATEQTWTEEQPCALSGSPGRTAGTPQSPAQSVASICSRSIWRTDRRTKNWLLSSNLSGFRDDLRDFDSTDEAKDWAEQVLVQFVEQLGARH